MMNRFIVLIFLGIIIAACTDDKVQAFDCDADQVNYNDDIKALVETNCATTNGCHIAGAVLVKPLSNYEETRDYVLNYYDAFLASITHTGNNPMPRGLPKLSDQNIELINCWYQNGAPE